MFFKKEEKKKKKYVELGDTFELLQVTVDTRNTRTVTALNENDLIPIDWNGVLQVKELVNLIFSKFEFKHLASLSQTSRFMHELVQKTLNGQLASVFKWIMSEERIVSSFENELLAEITRRIQKEKAKISKHRELADRLDQEIRNNTSLLLKLEPPLACIAIALFLSLMVSISFSFLYRCTADSVSCTGMAPETAIIVDPILGGLSIVAFITLCLTCCSNKEVKTLISRSDKVKSQIQLENQTLSNLEKAFHEIKRMPINLIRERIDSRELEKLREEVKKVEEVRELEELKKVEEPKKLEELKEVLKLENIDNIHIERRANVNQKITENVQNLIDLKVFTRDPGNPNRFFLNELDNPEKNDSEKAAFSISA